MRIKDVAQLAGVSTATVSHVINGTRYVSDDIKQKVRAVIEERNYIPNLHARNLSSGRSTTLGLIVSDSANPFFPELVKSIQAQALAHGYDVMLTSTGYDPTRIVSCVQRMIEQQVRGVAIMTSEMALALRERLTNRQIPVVYLDLGTRALLPRRLAAARLFARRRQADCQSEKVGGLDAGSAATKRRDRKSHR
jgi:LacI family transcriptional regulator